MFIFILITDLFFLLLLLINYIILLSFLGIEFQLLQQEYCELPDYNMIKDTLKDKVGKCFSYSTCVANERLYLEWME